jgi:signal transduction histidine kinase
MQSQVIPSILCLRTTWPKYFSLICLGHIDFRHSSVPSFLTPNVSSNKGKVDMNKQSMRVLLVEDNPADATLVRQSFSRFSSIDWRFLGVETLGDAITAYQHTDEGSQHTPFDLVLLDLGLPDTRGLATVQQFFAASPEAPVIVLSGLDDTEVALQAIEQGVQDYLVKDQINLQSLLKAVQFAIRRQSNFRQLQQLNQISQQALYQAQEVNEQQIGFIGMVLHEIKNPLGIIQMSVEMLNLNVDGVITSKIQKWLNKIQSANEQVSEMLNDLLIMSRLDVKHALPNFSCLRLCNFCTDLVNEVQQIAGGDHLIKLKVAKEVKHAFTDAQLLQSILNNLIVNAIKYTPQGGIINVTVTADRRWLTFIVQDTGIGIPEDDLPQLFEHFYRASNTKDIEGTGLGLAIVQRCVNSLEGKIEVESQVDQGTTFKVSLPLILSESQIPEQYLLQENLEQCVIG